MKVNTAAPHTCAPPALSAVLWRRHGSTWRCRRCGTLWVLLKGQSEAKNIWRRARVQTGRRIAVLEEELGIRENPSPEVSDG